jgi:LmbE family N-acetylglucosaminyl deacetylase
MINLTLSNRSGALKVLCIGCHSDDVEIGCGGTILKLAESYPESEFHWVVFSGGEVRKAEAQRAAALFGGSCLKAVPLVLQFKDGFMPWQGAELKRVFEEDLKPLCPDLVFTHYRLDAHQDHRTIAELTWNTFRNHLILEYEIPKYDGDLGQPGFFVPLEREICETKTDHLLDAFESQRGKRWFEKSTFMALLRLRGMECNSESGYAEAFYCRKSILK